MRKTPEDFYELFKSKFEPAFDRYGCDEMRLFFDKNPLVVHGRDIWVAFRLFLNERASKIDKDFVVKKGEPLKRLLSSRSVDWCDRLYDDMFRILDVNPWRVRRCAVKLMTSLYLDVYCYVQEFEEILVVSEHYNI